MFKASAALLASAVSLLSPTLYSMPTITDGPMVRFERRGKGRGRKSPKLRFGINYSDRGPSVGAFIADTGWTPKPSSEGPQFNRAPARRSWRIARKHLKKQGLLTR